jgi:hypothetical protein
MNILKYVLLILIAFLIFVKPIHAQTAPVPVPQPTPSPSQDQIESQQNAASQDAQGVFGYIIDFVNNFTDKSLAGGLIFTTPDMFPQEGAKITLPDGSQFNNFDSFRSIFEIIAGSIIAIFLAIIGIVIAIEDAPFQLKPLIIRFIITGVLLVGTPFLLRQSIIGINALNTQIKSMGVALLNDKTYVDMNTLGYATAPNMMLTRAQTQLASGASKPSDFLLPEESISIFGDFIKSLFVFIFKAIIFVIFILFFIFGFLFIVFQFAIRFISLLFLSLVSPLVAPFALSKRTEGVVKAYFMAWVSFLIHQPAFILGYFMVMNIFHGVLTSGTVSIGTIFLFSGSLFFLGGVNGLITRIFGEPWTALATNIAAAASAAPYMGALFGSATKLKEGAMSGHVRGFRSLAGRTLARKAGWLSRDGKDFSIFGVKKLSPDQNTESSGNSSGRNGSEQQYTTPKTTRSFTPSVTREIQKMGVQAEVLSNKTGEVLIPKTPVYAYAHPEKPLTVNYFSKEEALRDGVRENQLKKTFIEGKFADYSNFYNTGRKNPHNTYITKKAKGTPYEGNTHGGLTISEDRVKNQLTVGKDYFKQKEIKGIIGKRSGNNNGTLNKNEEKIVKIYTLNE